MRFRRPVRRDGDHFVIDFTEPERNLVGSLVTQLRDLLTTDSTALRRLFPPPYGEDDERNAGYAALAGTELVERRLAALDVVEATISARELSEDELLAWMRSINDVRLVLGTILDVSDDEPLASEPTAPETQAAYEYLGYLLDVIVGSLGD